MSIEARGQGPRDVGGDILLEVGTDHVGAETEQGVGLDHLHAGAEGDVAVHVGVGVAVRMDDRDHALAQPRRADGEGQHGHHRQGQDGPAAPGPEQVEQSRGGGDPDAAGHRQNDCQAAQQDRDAGCPAPPGGRGAVPQDDGQAGEQSEHQDFAEGHPMAVEAGDARGDV